GRGGPHPDGLRPPRAPRPCRPGGPTASKERTMREVLVDFITTLDGYASGEGWPGFWGLEGPEYLAWLTSKPEVTYLMGANTYRLMSGFAGGEVPPPPPPPRGGAGRGVGGVSGPPPAPPARAVAAPGGRGRGRGRRAPA